MVRKLRLQFPGALYQGMNRGDWREDHPLPRPVSRLRRGTTLTLAWMAARLEMGVPTLAAHLLYRQDRKEPPSANTLF